MIIYQITFQERWDSKNTITKQTVIPAATTERAELFNEQAQRA
jgi:hypothetical protein